ncbi:hypothetical protein [Catenulispora subtropica]
MVKPEQIDRPGTYGYTYAEGHSACIEWRDGLITLNKGDATPELAGIAQKLGARLVGDDEEEYFVDGSYAHWSRPRPILLTRPLNVDEAAAAWRQTFEQLDDDYDAWRPSPYHAQHALATFRAFAVREIASADVPDADGLLYQYGPFGSEGDPVFTVSFVRRLATDADGGHTRVECRLDYSMSEELAGLGRYSQWWFADEAQPRDQWFDALADRPEWRLLSTVTPLTVVFDTDTAC